MRIPALFLSTTILLAATSAAFAHGGGLDSSGCHTNRKIGDRHCHRGSGSSSKRSIGLVSGAVVLVSVGDGDTIRVKDATGNRVTIRLACIDAPETSQGNSGSWSTKTLKGLITGKSITLKPQTKDHYGRTVAEVYSGSTNINLQMIRLGAAYPYRKYLGQCDRAAYLSAEAAASKRSIGVWGPYRPNQKPWDYRRSRRNR